MFALFCKTMLWCSLQDLVCMILNPQTYQLSVSNYTTIKGKGYLIMISSSLVKNGSRSCIVSESCQCCCSTTEMRSESSLCDGTPSFSSSTFPAINSTCRAILSTCLTSASTATCTSFTISDCSCSPCSCSG